MPREKIAAKFIGQRDADGIPVEFHNGIEPRDYSESEFDALSDEHKTTMAGSKLYDLRNDGDEMAAKAEKRVEKAEAAAAPPEAVSVTVAEAKK